MAVTSSKTNIPPKRSTAQRIERALVEEISAGELTPGQRLDEA